jgi:hypothetical protein
MQEKTIEVFGFWYNPNIHPFTEYQKRLEVLKNYTQKINLQMIWWDKYELEEFLQGVVFRENKGLRCLFCYFKRLEATAQVAKHGKFNGFTTTLLYSKFQDHEMIKIIGENLAKRHGLIFYYDDFRLGWQEAIETSKKLGMYRQQYCGCIYSEKERYYKKLVEQ